jgi:glycosyltransferase involved in cell wall biosynthesis
MHTEKNLLRIAYAGTLACFDPDKQKLPRYSWKNWFWGFKALNVDSTTRSAYFLFRGLQELLRRDAKWEEKVHVELWGLIDPANVQQADKFGISKMVSIGSYLPKEESIRKLSEADVMYLPLESGREGQRPLYIPGKLFELLVLGKPVLALAEPSDCREILEHSGLACMAHPRDFSAIADLIERLYNNKELLHQIYTPDKNYIARFDAANKTAELAQVFDRVLQGSDLHS